MKYGINKFFYFLYRWYTMLQVKATPTLQSMLQNLHAKYGDNIPENIRVDFRKQSRHLMRYIDLLTFNGRTMVMVCDRTNGTGLGLLPIRDHRVEHRTSDSDEET